jgi:hypothetical protein
VEVKALLRNSLPRDEVETKFAGRGSEFHSLSVLKPMQFLEDGGVVFLMSGDHVIDDAGQLESGCGHYPSVGRSELSCGGSNLRGRSDSDAALVPPSAKLKLPGFWCDEFSRKAPYGELCPNSIQRESVVPRATQERTKLARLMKGGPLTSLILTRNDRSVDSEWEVRSDNRTARQRGGHLRMSKRPCMRSDSATASTT